MFWIVLRCMAISLFLLCLRKAVVEEIQLFTIDNQILAFGKILSNKG